ncbi:hypothetical protein OY671_007926, partial [Metschnikowia pulcherrima]
MAKGGFAGLGVSATPSVASASPPSQAAAIISPISIAQDVISVWSFRHSWDRWIVAWMSPGAVVGIGIGWAFAAWVNENVSMAASGAITSGFGLYRSWSERGHRVVAASTSPGWVGSSFGAATGLTSQIAHAGGPPFQIWVAPRKSPHVTYVGTNSISFAAINWLKSPSYIASGVMTHQVSV